ncbi:PepSY-like domain-containing protein [Fulvivirga sp. M361]|uniref:PepSY-like domain-containing protein n=1 Tax=Fulvivirga sp. M361 TaxID=2594266 RepID=UPI001623CE0B|nr:PepSY-like domain-containing protein [Fulvivirga sp. M361]
MGHSLAVSGQSDKARDKVQHLFKKKYPQAESIHWEKDDHNNIEVQFEQNDEKYRADFDLNGNWIETEKSISWKDLPKKVKASVEKKYDKDDIAEIEWVHHNKKGVFYDVEFKKKGKNKDVEFNTSGKQIN